MQDSRSHQQTVPNCPQAVPWKEHSPVLIAEYDMNQRMAWVGKDLKN